MDTRKTIGLLLLCFISIFVLGSYINALNTFYPLSHVSASDYAPTTPSTPFGGTFTYGFIAIGVVIITALAVLFKDRILELIT